MKLIRIQLLVMISLSLIGLTTTPSAEDFEVISDITGFIWVDTGASAGSTLYQIEASTTEQYIDVSDPWDSVTKKFNVIASGTAKLYEEGDIPHPTATELLFPNLPLKCHLTGIHEPIFMRDTGDLADIYYGMGEYGKLNSFVHFDDAGFHHSFPQGDNNIETFPDGPFRDIQLPIEKIDQTVTFGQDGTINGSVLVGGRRGNKSGVSADTIIIPVTISGDFDANNPMIPLPMTITSNFEITSYDSTTGEWQGTGYVEARPAVPTPSLTVWGIIGLAVLIIGCTVYLFVRRRPKISAT